MNKRLTAIISIILCAVLIIILTPIASKGSVPASAPEGQTSPQAAASVVIINEVMAQNRSAVPDEDGNYYDYVELYNTSSEEVSLSSLFLTDDPSEPGKQSLLGLSIPADSYIIIYCSGLSKTGHASFKLSAGETVALFDSSSQMLDAVTIETAPANSVMMRDAGGEWVISAKYTPAMANTDENHSAYLASFEAIGSETVYINEVISRNITTYMLPDGSAPDWTELYNAGSSPVDISGWTLTDDETEPFSFIFPVGTVIGAGEYMLIICDGLDRPTAEPPHAQFSISSGGETVTLYNARRQVVDRLAVPMLEADTSYGRSPDDLDELQVFLQPTPLLPNDSTGVSAMVRQMLFANTSGLIISEVLSSNKSGLTVGDFTPDWLELMNISDVAVNLGEFGLSKSVSRPGEFPLPEKVLQPGERVVIVADKELHEAGGDPEQISVGFNISAGGDAILLAHSGRIVDKIAAPALQSDISYGRAASDSSLFYYYDSPSPGEENPGSGYLGVAKIPEPSTESGVYNGVDSVSLRFETDDGMTLYYTTDGSLPTTSSQRLAGELNLTKTTTIKLLAQRENYLPSEIEAFSYIINENHSLPIVALSADPGELYDPQTGMLADGPEYHITDSNGYHYKANYWKEIEIGANVEYFDAQGNRLLSQSTGVKVSGATSRDQAQKSLLLIARNIYGENRLHFSPFPNRDYDEYKAVVLRNTGQDYYRARMRDAMLSSLMEGTGVYYQDTQPVIVYLNGEYYGQYNLRERINRYSLAQFEGITEQSVIDSADILSGSGRTGSQVVHGSYKEYQELVSFVKENSLNVQSNLDYVLSQVDVENLFDYVSFQIIIGNSDPSNIKFYKFDAPGSKWKWIIYDLDWANNTGSNGTAYDSFDRMLKSSGLGRNNTDNSIIQALLKNEDMEKLFLERFAKLFLENFDPDRVHARIDEYYEMLKPEMERQFEFWGPKEAYSRSVSSWESEVGALHNYIDSSRPYLIRYCQSWFNLTDSEMRGLFGDVFDQLK
ncbi:MAG: lamin tail domain-containing protein [Christensenellales bacterium]